MPLQPLKVAAAVHDLVDARLKEEDREERRGKGLEKGRCSLGGVQIWHPLTLARVRQNADISRLRREGSSAQLQMRPGLRRRRRGQILSPDLGGFLRRRLGILGGSGLWTQLLRILQCKLSGWLWKCPPEPSGRPEDFAVYAFVPVGVNPFTLNVRPTIGRLRNLIGNCLLLAFGRSAFRTRLWRGLQRDRKTREGREEKQSSFH
jgi:hypothetical protein